MNRVLSPILDPSQRLKRLRADPDFEARRIAGLRRHHSDEVKQAVTAAAAALLNHVTSLPEELREPALTRAPKRVQKELRWLAYLLRPASGD